MKDEKKVAPIKDADILSVAASVIKPTEVWSGGHHARLIWGLFRKMGFEPGAVGSDEFKKAVAQWESYYANGSLGFSSNTGRRLAEAGVCSSEQKVSLAEYK